MVLEFMLSDILFEDLFFGGIHYLPASRAGILHSYRSIARALVSLAPMAPIRGVDVPGIPGPLADFLGELLLMAPKPRGRRLPGVEGVVKSFERDILEGEVALERQAQDIPPALVFKFNGERLPMARVSSMIAEVAPLSVLLKYGSVSSGDTLIIEEPEAHLHPDKQAKLAVLLARLVNEAKLRLLITTHSEIMLAKLSNLISLGAMPPEKAVELGYPKHSTLDPERVSVYSFRPQPDGVVVEPIEVTREGIPDDVFYKVVESLYEETMSIHYKLQELREAT